MMERTASDLLLWITVAKCLLIMLPLTVCVCVCLRVCEREGAVGS